MSSISAASDADGTGFLICFTPRARIMVSTGTIQLEGVVPGP